MDNTNSGINLERLLEQIVLLNPTLKYKPEKLSVLRKRMEDQLLGEAVVQIEHMEPLYDKWEERVKQKIYNLKRFLKEDDDENKSQTKASNEEIKEEIQRGSSDDDESLIIPRSRHHNGKAKRIRDESSERGYLFDKYEDVPLSLRRTPRKRKRSSKYISPAKSKRSYHSNNSVSFHRKGNHHHKNLREDSTVSTSGIVHHCEQENVFSEQGTSSRTFHLKIPSLFKSDFHEINFSELEITRRVIDARAQVAKERILQKSLHPPPPHSKKKRSYKRRPSISLVTSITDSGSDQREREEAELSQLINDVIGTTGSEEETWRATNALENINNEIIDNYSVLPHTSTHSQPEFLGFDNEKSAKRRYTKSSNKAIKEKQPPKKRGRKPKTQQYFSQPPTKSNLAAYVESFGNECDMRGSQTPAGSSTRSQPLVSSTTQNFELVDQQHEPSPVMYYLHGNWQSGDPCQLLTTDVNLATAGSQLPTNNLNISYDESARVAGINLPIITPFRQHNTLDNSIVLPVMTEGFITTALQPLPTSTNATTRNESIPPPAHKSSEILDLSIKTSSQFSSNPISSVHNNVIVHADVSFGCPMAIIGENENDDSPLDLSINAIQNNSTSSCDQEYGILTETQCCTEVDNGQDDEFIRRLIETSDFDLGLDQLPEGNENSSFKAALDMPLLDTIDDVGENNMLKETSSVLPTNDSTYASMPEDSSSFLNCSLGDDYNFTDESTREIFKQLLDVEPLTSATTPIKTTDDEGERTNKEEEEAETTHSVQSLRTDNENPSEEDKATKETVAEKTATKIQDDKDVLKEDSKPQEKSQRQKEPEVALEKEPFPSPKNPGLNMSTSSIINCAGKIRKRRITVTSAADPSPKLAKMQREQITITITSGGENESIPNDKNEGKATFDLSKNIDTAPINLKKQTEHRATTFTECRNEICIKELNTNKSDISPSIQDNSKSLCSIDDEENKFTHEKKVVQEACKELSTSHKKEADGGGVVVNETTKFINKAKPRICEEIKHNETNNIIVITIPEHPEIHCHTKDMESAGEEEDDLNKMQSNKKIKNETCETTTKCNDTTKTTDITKFLKENVKKSNNNTTASLQNTSTEKSKDKSKSLVSMLDIAQDNNNNCSNDNIDNTIQLKHDDDDDDDDPSLNICNVTKEIDQPAVSLNLNKLTNDNCLPRQTGNDDGEEDIEMMDCLNITEENIIIDLCKPLNLEKIPEPQTEHKESEPVASANKIQSIVNNFHSNEQQQQKQTINTDKDKENISSFHEQQQKDDAIPINTLNQNGDENIKLDYPYTNESDNVDRKSHQEPLYESSHEKDCQEQPADLICKIEICDRLNSFEKDSSDTFPTLEISESEDEIGTENTTPEHIDEKIHIADENISKENGLQKENYVGQSKDLENNVKVENEEKAANNKPPELQMSLLELECKLEEEDALNFEADDEDLDALVLDTSSCGFDSPIEDRFQNSSSLSLGDDISVSQPTKVTNEELPKISPTTSTPTDFSNVQRSTEVPKFPNLDNILKINDNPNSASVEIFKHFKIPKKLKAVNKTKIHNDNNNRIPDAHLHPIVHLERIPLIKDNSIHIRDFYAIMKSKDKTDVTNKTSKSEPNVMTKKENPVPEQGNSVTISTTKQPIFRCTFNNVPAILASKELPSCTQGQVHIQNSNRQHCSSYGIKEVAAIFGITCLPHLENLCHHPPLLCKMSHQMNDLDTVFNSLNGMNVSDLNVAYSFAYNHHKLYRQFFILFCNIYTQRNNRMVLLKMVNDCERYPEQAENLIVLFDALVKCGLSPSNACRLMLKRSRDRSTPVIDALVAIIMKTGWAMFSDYIEGFTMDNQQYHFRIPVLEEMATELLNSSNSNLVQLNQVFFKCVQTVHLDELPMLCSPNLLKCLGLMATSK